MHRPNCGKLIFLYAMINEGTEIYKDKYTCSCGKKFDIEYDFVLAELIIKTGLYLENK
jgi:hypothetical protein